MVTVGDLTWPDKHPNPALENIKYQKPSSRKQNIEDQEQHGTKHSQSYREGSRYTPQFMRKICNTHGIYYVGPTKRANGV